MHLRTSMIGWTGHHATAVRIRQRAHEHHDPEPHGVVWPLGATECARPPMFLMQHVEAAEVSGWIGDRDVIEEDGQRFVNLVRLSFGDLDRDLAAELMPTAIRRSIQLEVWCPVPPIIPGMLPGYGDDREWDHYTIWDVSPRVMHWRPNPQTGRNFWEFIGTVRKPTRAIEPVMVMAHDAYGQLPLYSVLRTPERFPAPRMRP